MIYAFFTSIMLRITSIVLLVFKYLKRQKSYFFFYSFLILILVIFTGTMAGRKVSDTVAIIRGMKIVVSAILREQEKRFPNMMKQSNIQNYTDEGFKGLEKLLGDIDASKVPVSFQIG